MISFTKVEKNYTERPEIGTITISEKNMLSVDVGVPPVGRWDAG